MRITIYPGETSDYNPAIQIKTDSGGSGTLVSYNPESSRSLQIIIHDRVIEQILLGIAGNSDLKSKVTDLLLSDEQFVKSLMKKVFDDYNNHFDKLLK